MADRKDILTGPDGDVYADGGDFTVGVSDAQHIQHILEAIPGDFKQFPTVGAGLRLFYMGHVDANLRRAIQKSLGADGYRARAIKLKNDKLTIDV